MALPQTITGATCNPCELDLGIYVPSINEERNEDNQLKDCQFPENIEASDIELEGDDAVSLTFLPIEPDENEEIREFCGRLSSLESWFPRASWADKLDFLTSVVHAMDIASLNRLVTEIGPPTKDMIYAYSQYTNSLYDMTPMDDNRTLTSKKIKEVKSRDFEWMNTLNYQKKLRVLVDLLEIGGGAIQRRIYNISHARLLKVEAERLTRIEDELAKMNETRGIGTAVRKKKLGGKKTKNVPKVASLKQPDTFKGPAQTKLKQAAKEWDTFMRGLMALAGQGKNEHKKGKKNKIKEETGPNQIELLPLWINRPILKALDNKSLDAVSKVGQYWKDSIAAVKREQKTRAALDKALIKLEANCALPMTVRKKKNEKKIKKPKHESVPARKKHKTGIKERSKSAEPVVQVPEVEVNRARVLSVVSHAMLIDCPPNVYNTRHTIIKMPDSFAVDPSLAVNKRWLAISSGSGVRLKSMITGSSLAFTLTGHEGPITSMVFHPTNDYLITGSSDKTVRIWEVWTQRMARLLKGHTEAIIGVAANDSYAISAGFDKLVKVFKWDNWECVWTITQEDPLSCIQLSHDSLLYVGMETGQIMIYNVQEKKHLLEIEYGHLGAVTRVFVANPLVATASVDGYVRLWDYRRLDNKCLLALKHRGRVNDIAISHLRVLSGCEEGDVYVWDIFSGKIIRRIVTNVECMPVIVLRVVEYDDHSKVIVCCESGTIVYNFPYNKKWHTEYRCANTVPMDGKMNVNRASDQRLRQIRGKLKNDERRELQLNRRLCTVPQLRQATGQLVLDSVVRDVLIDEDIVTGVQERHIPHYKTYEERKELEHVRWSRTEENPKFRRHSPKILSYKDTLPVYNPYKYSL